MDNYTVIVIIFGILILLFLIVLFFLNRLILFQNRIKKTFSTTKVYLEEKTILIDKISYFIKNNLKHEDNLVKKMEQIKKELNNINICKEGIQSIKNAEKLYQELQGLNKVYPTLKKNQEYQILTKELLTNQERIIYSMDEYNKGVMNYNQYRKQPLIHFLSKVFRFPSYPDYNQ